MRANQHGAHPTIKRHTKPLKKKQAQSHAKLNNKRTGKNEKEHKRAWATKK